MVETSAVPSYEDGMDPPAFDRLTEGQKECLRLYHARFEVKDIARRIDRSPVTVNQRLSAARRHLGVERSSEAARLLVEYESGLHQPPIYEPAPLAEPAPFVPSPVTETLAPRLAIALPFPTRDRPVNDLGFGAKLLYAVGLAALIALVFGGAVAALTGLSELF